MSDQPPALAPDPPARHDRAGGDAAGHDDDLPADDLLLGIPWSRLLSPDGLRGLALVALALAILLWPGRTDQVLARLVGLGLAWLTATTAVQLVRNRSERTFWSMLLVGVGGGFALSLVLQPEDSLTSVVQACGGVVATYALVGVWRMLRARRVSAWHLVQSVGVAPLAVLLLAYPEVLLAALTSAGAGLLGAIGLLQVFRGPPPPREEGQAAPDHLRETVLGWIRDRPDEAEDRGVLQEKVFFEGDAAPVRYARFAVLMLFASIIAAVGVVVESTAVVIGAMLVAPLMVPLMGTALSVAMGWPRRMRRAAGIALSGIVISILTGAVVGSALPRTVDVVGNAEIASRTSPTIVDLAIAVAAGAAGAYALSRRDVSDSLPGVAVAIALVPPLTVAGLCWQQQAWASGNGALLLFLTNAVAILVVGGAMFVLVGAAPLERVSEGQRRLRTVIVGLFSFAAVVVMLLLLNGETLARSELSRSDVDQVLSGYVDEHPDYRVVDQRTASDGTVVIDLAGPDAEPPDLDALVARLEQAAQRGTEVRITWIEQQQVTVSGADDAEPTGDDG